MDSGLAKSLRHNSEGAQSMNISTNSTESAAPSSSNLTLIKVSDFVIYFAAREGYGFWEFVLAIDFLVFSFIANSGLTIKIAVARRFKA